MTPTKPALDYLKELRISPAEREAIFRWAEAMARGRGYDDIRRCHVREAARRTLGAKAKSEDVA